MSQGAGRVERAIIAAVQAEPDNAFTVADLCDRVYPGINRIEKKHRVAVQRAMKSVTSRSHGELALWTEGFWGYGKLVLFGRYNVISYAMARLKADPFNNYRSNDPRVHAARISGESDIRTMIEPGGEKFDLVAED